MLTVILAIPQESLDPLSNCDALIVTVPKAFNWAVIFLVTTLGLTVSCTVITAFALSILPLVSVTYNFTATNPTFEQSKLDLLNVLVAIPQLSVLPLSTWAAVIVATPVAFK